MKYILLLSLTLAVGCSSLSSFSDARDDDYYFDGLTLSKREIREHWLTTLSEKNPHLYLEIAKAFIISRKANKVAYICRTNKNGIYVYNWSFESGHGNDVISIYGRTNEIQFDHFMDIDGPSYLDSAQKVWVDKKVKQINKEVLPINFR